MKEIAALVRSLTVSQNNFCMIREFNEIAKNPKRSVSCFAYHTSCDKYFYLWELDFPSDFDMTCRMLKDKRLKIATRSLDQKALLENKYNVKVDAVVEDWNRSQLEEFLGVNNE